MYHLILTVIILAHYFAQNNSFEHTKSSDNYNNSCWFRDTKENLITEFNYDEFN